MMKKLFTAAVFSVCATVSLHAQITTYKVQNGIKTPLTKAEQVEIEIPLDDNLVPMFNLLVEIDIKAFKAKYTYDNLFYYYDQPFDESDRMDFDYINYFANFSFNSPLNSKKYGNDQFLRLYLFETEEVKKDNKNQSIFENYIHPTEVNIKKMIRLTGRYITGQEEYYYDGAWKKADTYSKAETLNKTLITYKTSGAGSLAVQYEVLVEKGRSGYDLIGRNEINSLLRQESKKIGSLSITNPLTGNAISLYPDAYQSFLDVWNGYEKQITGDQDKQKAIDLLKEWEASYKMLLISHRDKPTLKAMNKELKGNLTFEQKIAVFKKYQQ